MSKKEIPLKEIEEEVPEPFNQQGKRARKSKWV